MLSSTIRNQTSFECGPFGNFQGVFAFTVVSWFIVPTTFDLYAPPDWHRQSFDRLSCFLKDSSRLLKVANDWLCKIWLPDASQGSVVFCFSLFFSLILSHSLSLCMIIFLLSLSLFLTWIQMLHNILNAKCLITSLMLRCFKGKVWI